MYIYIPSAVDTAHCIITVLCEGYPIVCEGYPIVCVQDIPLCVEDAPFVMCVLIIYLQSTIVSILQSSVCCHVAAPEALQLNLHRFLWHSPLVTSCSGSLFRATMPVFQLPKRSAGRRTLCFFAAYVNLVLMFDQCWQIWSVARKDFGTLWIGTGWR